MIQGRYIILMFFSLILLQSVSAELILTPNNLDFQVLDNQIVSQQITIYNNYTFPIYNVSLTELPLKVSSDKIPVLNNQSSAIINVTVQSNEPFQASKNAKLIFFMKAVRQEQVSTIQVNISRDGFLPRSPIIIKGSTIKWVNQDNIIHSVTSTSFDQTLNPTSEFSYAYNTEGEYPYHDTYLGYFGTVFVINSSVEEYVYFPDYAVNYPLNVNVFLHQTDLTLELMETNLTCQVGIGCETVIRINNPSNVTALNVTVLGGTPNKNYFNLNGNTNTFVLLKIIPTATTTLETNATRVQEISIQGLNFPKVTIPISFFVPYYDLDKFNATDDASDLLIQELKIFCITNPNSLICNQTRKVEYINITEYRSPPLPYNYTQEEINYMKTQLAETNTKQENLNTMFNDIKTVNEEMSKNLINLTDSLKLDREEKAVLSERISFQNKVLLALGTIIITLIGLGAFLYFYNKNSKENELFGGLH